MISQRPFGAHSSSRSDTCHVGERAAAEDVRAALRSVHARDSDLGRPGPEGSVHVRPALGRALLIDELDLGRRRRADGAARGRARASRSTTTRSSVTRPAGRGACQTSAPVVASIARTRFAVGVREDESGAGPPRDRAAHVRHEQAIAGSVAGDDADPGAVDVRDPRIRLRSGPAREPNARPGERPAHAAVGLERGELVLASPRRRSVRTATSSPRGRARGAASSRPAARPRRPHRRRRAADPAPAGRRARAGRARRRRPRESRPARPGRAGSAPRRAPPRRRRSRPARGAASGSGRSTGWRSANAAATTLHDALAGLVLAGDLDPLELAPHSSSPSASRPRRRRELTVPRGRSSASAISPGVNSSR